MKIRSIINFIKKHIFKSREKKEKTNIELNVKDNNIENLKKNESYVRINSINWNLINKISKNDIIFVKMNEEAIKAKNIENEHSKRPLVVTKKDNTNGYIEGYYCTSNINNFIFRDNYNGLKLVLNKNTYHFSKNTLVMLNNLVTLPYENVIHTMSHLSDKDIKFLYKYNKLFHNIPVTSCEANKLVEPGDVISKDKKRYLIYQTDSTYCYGYEIKRSKKEVNLKENHNYFKFYNKLYLVNYTNPRIFNTNDTLCIIDRFNKDIVKEVRDNKKKIRYEKKKNEKEKVKTKTQKVN